MSQKIILRISGSGGLNLVLTDPSGREHPLDWGPEPHVESSYNRPGDEWGIGSTFNQSGCWKLAATRGTQTSVTYWIKID